MKSFYVLMLFFSLSFNLMAYPCDDAHKKASLFLNSYSKTQEITIGFIKRCFYEAGVETKGLKEVFANYKEYHKNLRSYGLPITRGFSKCFKKNDSFKSYIADSQHHMKKLMKQVVRYCTAEGQAILKQEISDKEKNKLYSKLLENRCLNCELKI